MPILGITLRWWGTLPVDPNSYKHYCSKGINFCVVPGGYEEATITDIDEERIFIKKRKGFIKYAIEYGYKVYPAYVFNEHKCFHTFGKLLNFRLWLNKFKMIGVFYFSWYLGFLPNPNVDINTVI